MGKINSAKKTVAAARKALGEKDYDVLENNCEHFATKCKTGKAKSKQADTAKAAIDAINDAINRRSPPISHGPVLISALRDF